MHDYRYYVKDNEEHYEIWIGDQIYRHESAPFGEGVYDLLDFHDNLICFCFSTMCLSSIGITSLMSRPKITVGLTTISKKPI